MKKGLIKALSQIEIRQRNAKSLELFGIQEKYLNFCQKSLLNQYINDSRNILWKPIIIDNKETKYIVSNTGLIKNKETNQLVSEHFNHKGYKVVSINANGICTEKLIHRLVAQAFIPNPENKPQVNHITGIKTCNWVGNLEWNTCKENIHHALRTGLFHIGLGENANSSVYTNAQIHQVCKLLEKGLLNTEISQITGVDVYVISKIKCRNCWTHISDQYNIPIPVQNATGSAAAASKYTDVQIHQVCKMIQEGYKNTNIAKITGVNRDMISRIRYGKNWIEIASQYGIKPFKKN